MPGITTEEFRQANHLEAGLWILIAVITLVIAIRRPGHTRSRCIILAAALLAFGISDIVEARTGAWWHPWWLLVWKTACVVVLLLLLVEHYRRRLRVRRGES